MLSCTPCHHQPSFLRFCDWRHMEEIIFKMKIRNISPALSMNGLLVVALALCRALHRLDLTCRAQP